MTAAAPTRARRLATSPLAAAGWCMVLRLLDQAGLARLASEAAAHRELATEWREAAPDDGDTGPRGRPGRWLINAPGGPALRSFYQSPVLLRTVDELTGMRWKPSGLDGSYSYYEAAGHHLDLHRDIDECDLTLISCLARSGQGLPALQAYPSALRRPLDELRADHAAPAVEVDLRPGESLLILGGVVPHRLPPLPAGTRRVVAPLCFTPA